MGTASPVAHMIPTCSGSWLVHSSLLGVRKQMEVMGQHCRESVTKALWPLSCLWSLSLFPLITLREAPAMSWAEEELCDKELISITKSQRGAIDLKRTWKRRLPTPDQGRHRSPSTTWLSLYKSPWGRGTRLSCAQTPTTQSWKSTWKPGGLRWVVTLSKCPQLSIFLNTIPSSTDSL